MIKSLLNQFHFLKNNLNQKEYVMAFWTIFETPRGCTPQLETTCAMKLNIGKNVGFCPEKCEGETHVYSRIFVVIFWTVVAQGAGLWKKSNRSPAVHSQSLKHLHNCLGDNGIGADADISLYIVLTWKEYNSSKPKPHTSPSPSNSSPWMTLLVSPEIWQGRRR